MLLDCALSEDRKGVSKHSQVKHSQLQVSAKDLHLLIERICMTLILHASCGVLTVHWLPGSMQNGLTAALVQRPRSGGRLMCVMLKWQRKRVPLVRRFRGLWIVQVLRSCAWSLCMFSQSSVAAADTYLDSQAAENNGPLYHLQWLEMLRSGICATEMTFLRARLTKTSGTHLAQRVQVL